MRFKLLFIMAALAIMAGLSAREPLQAGTLSAGGQSWYVWWDSGMAKMTAASVEAQLKREMNSATGVNFTNYGGLEVGDPESRGFIYGPLLGYQTDDKKWDFTLAMMWWGTYSTKVPSSVTITGTFPIIGSATQKLGINTDLTVEHKDIDFRAAYKLTDLFLVFGGYKYQSYETAIKADYLFNLTSPMSAALDFSMKAQMHMPYAGVGIMQPFYDIFTAKANAGVGLIAGGNIDQKLSIRSSNSIMNADYSFDKGKVEMAYCLMGDAAVAVKLVNRVNLELGYQYQRFTFKVKDVDLNADGRAEESGSETDVFHGVTVKAVMLFDI